MVPRLVFIKSAWALPSLAERNCFMARTSMGLSEMSGRLLDLRPGQSGRKMLCGSERLGRHQSDIGRGGLPRSASTDPPPCPLLGISRDPMDPASGAAVVELATVVPEAVRVAGMALEAVAEEALAEVEAGASPVDRVAETMEGEEVATLDGVEAVAVVEVAAVVEEEEVEEMDGMMMMSTLTEAEEVVGRAEGVAAPEGAEEVRLPPHLLPLEVAAVSTDLKMRRVEGARRTRT
jgi:hypothetical protein